MNRARKWGFAAIALSLLLVAACGGKENNTLNSPVTQTDAAEKTLRVVATTVTYPDFLYSLGVIPVAAENANAEFPSYLNGAFDAVPKLGGVLNLEGILAAEPDLIIGANWRDAKNVDQLNKIAKTILLPDRDNWHDELRDMGDALDKKEQAEQVIADYEDQIKKANESLKPLVGSANVHVYANYWQRQLCHGTSSEPRQSDTWRIGTECSSNFPKGRGEHRHFARNAARV